MQESLKEYRVDLHVHTCLSPCAEITMSPLRVLKRAREVGLHIIGICDHNSAKNVETTIKVADNIPKISALAGLEITSVEEVHILAIFGNIENAMKMQEIVYSGLPEIENDPDLFGSQVIANENDEVIGFEQRLLINATNLSLKELVNKIHELSGIAVASHIDREAFGILGQLGFMPDDVLFDALEVSSKIPLNEAKNKFSEYSSFTFITSPDAHMLHDIGLALTTMILAEPTLEEIKLALKNEGGRRIIVDF